MNQVNLSGDKNMWRDLLAMREAGSFPRILLYTTSVPKKKSGKLFAPRKLALVNLYRRDKYTFDDGVKKNPSKKIL